MDKVEIKVHVGQNGSLVAVLRQVREAVTIREEAFRPMNWRVIRIGDSNGRRY